MSRVEELIKEYCPDGVEYKKISEVVTFRRGKGLSKSNKGTGNVPIILYGELYTIYGNYIHKIISHCNKDKAIKATKLSYDDLILPTSSTTKEAKIGKASVLKVNDPVYLGSDAIVMTAHDILNADFLMYYINSDIFEKEKMKCVKGTTVRHLNQSALSKIKIPVPPLPVQEEIARILDSFTELTAELTKELTARKKQYEYYRNEMLSFNGGAVERLLKRYCPNEVEYKKIKEIAEVGTGNSNGNEASEDGEYPFFIRSKTVKRKNTYEYDEEAVIIPGEGGIGEIYHYINGKYALHQRVYRIHFISSSINAKFAYYYFNAKFKNFIDKKAVSATVKSIRKPMIESFTIPVPPLPVQEEIVRVLDSFDKLNNSITNGLPAEIEARKKQYEYYKNKLLTFNESVR